MEFGINIPSSVVFSLLFSISPLTCSLVLSKEKTIRFVSHGKVEKL